MKFFGKERLDNSESDSSQEQDRVRDLFVGIKTLSEKAKAMSTRLEAMDPQNRPESIDMNLLSEASDLYEGLHWKLSRIEPGMRAPADVDVNVGDAIDGPQIRLGVLSGEIVRIVTGIYISHNESRAQEGGTGPWLKLKTKYLSSSVVRE